MTKPPLTLEEMHQEMARLAAQQADLARSQAELERRLLSELAAKHNLVLVPHHGGPVQPDAVVLPPQVAPAAMSETRVVSPESAPSASQLRFLPDLVKAFRMGESYSALRDSVRKSYDYFLERLIKDIPAALDELDKDAITRFYEMWREGNRISLSHSMATKLRMLFKFGAGTLNDPNCQRLYGIMNSMHFELPGPRAEFLNLEQVNNIRASAHQLGYPLIALAQAIQFELMLSQKDLIGEWIPVTDEQWSSDLIVGDVKWVHGMRWEEIDSDLVLHHVTSFRQQELHVDLKHHKMVMEELKKLGPLPKDGPMIVHHRTKIPYTGSDFRRFWRKVADHAGVPKEVKNSDSKGRLEGRQYQRISGASPLVENSEKEDRALH
jgi:hypothetical protein